MTTDSKGLPDQWFVTNGVVAMGPVEFERLATGLAGGKIPPASFVRHKSWRVWRELREIEKLSTRDRFETVLMLADISGAAEKRAANPSSCPPPPLEDAPDSTADSQPPLSSMRPAAVDPVAVLAAARNLEDALLLTLSTAIAAANADVGLLHQTRPEHGAVVTSYAHGKNAEALLGARIPEDDPALVSARTGRTVMGEPQHGDTGRYIAGRLSPCLGTVRGVAMVPVVVFGELVALIELGRGQTPFRAREIARVEDVIEAFTARVVVQGWI